MEKLENSSTIKHLLNIVINVVSRRTTKTLAISIVNKSIEQLKAKYDFLKYIQVEDSSYSEKSNDISVGDEINNIEPNQMEKVIDELFDTIFKSLGRNVGFFYIREIQEDIEKEIGSFFNEYDVNLSIKQQEHIINIMESGIIRIQEIRNSEILEIILSAFVKLLKMEHSESFTKDTIMDTIHRLEEKYDFLKYISIIEKQDPQNPYEYNINPEIDKVVIAERGQVIQKILEEIGKASDPETRRFIGEKFDMLMSKRDLSKISKIGVKTDDVGMALIKEGHQLLLTKIFEAFTEVIESNLSADFAIKYLNSLLEKFQDKHEVLKYIQIDKSKYSDGVNAIIISPEINSVASIELAKAIKDILSRAQMDLKEATRTFIKDFEMSLGKENLEEIKKIGVNMNLLEMRAV